MTEKDPTRIEMSPEMYERAREIFIGERKEVSTIVQLIRELSRQAIADTDNFWDEAAQLFGYEDSAALLKARKQVRIYWHARTMGCDDLLPEQVRRAERDEQEGSITSP